MTTVDHKKIGIMYSVTAFIFFLIGGLEALLLRIQLGAPDQTFLRADTYNQVFTMHGTTMIFLVIMPLSAGLANYLLPIMIGARDVAFPRINALGFWVFLAGGLFMYSSFFLGGAPNGGWFGYVPLTRQPAGPQHRLLGLRPPDPGHRLADRRRQPDRHRHQHAGAGHEPDADAHLRVDEPGGPVPAALRHPGHHRRPVPAQLRPARSRPTSSTWRRDQTRCSGNTCSGCSAIRRSTS